MARILPFKQRPEPQRDIKKATRERTRRLSPGEALRKAPMIQDVRSLAKSFTRAASESSLRDRVIFLILSSVGMRSSELVSLTKSCFAKDRKGRHTLRYFRTKTDDFHTVRLKDRTHRRILRSIEMYHARARLEDDHILFSLPNHLRKNRRTRLTTRSLQRIINAWGLKDGTGKLIAGHAMRHFVGWTASERHGFLYAQKLLGHRDPKTTSLYYTDPAVYGLDV